MKKVLFAIAVLCLTATQAFAQTASSGRAFLTTTSTSPAQVKKGDMGINVHAGISSTGGAQGLAGVEFRVAVADGWRLAPQFNIGGGHDLKFFYITVDAHYVINTTLKNFSVYPIAGVGYDHYWQKYRTYKSTANRIFLDLGFGGEYAINEAISITAEAKSQWMTNMSKGMLLVGCSYKF